ncbi:MAG: transporter substrate-binding domain-containing protein [Alphaproteobacteria bacterium]|nr:transporter substrate-binding domain-containing protein [Alphaproteobacteria bacterium]
MASKHYRIGVLFSNGGPYGVVSGSMRNGALLAFDEIARDSSYDFTLEPVTVDPAGEPARYPQLGAALLLQGIRHVVGCYTSSSRKDVIPLFEKYDSLLWYPSHYEGFESSTNVIYTGAAPNHHIIPLIQYLLAHMGKRAYCVGSNYIWSWENNRILREGLNAAGGSVIAERYFPVGETDHSKVIQAILETRPDFVFNTLIGTSAYYFFRAFRATCGGCGIDQASTIPIASCSLSEPELAEIGPGAMDGHISSSVYFSTIETETNRRFVRDYGDMFPSGPSVSADAEASYVAVKLLAASIAAAGSDDVDAVRHVIAQQRIEAPQGPVWIDDQTSHAYLTPRIGRSNTGGGFEVVFAAGQPVRPDPYLVQTTPRYATLARRPKLMLVK